MGKMKDSETVLIRSMGKALRITAWFTSDDAANDYMKKHPDEAVIAVTQDGLVLLANKYDHGR